MISEWIPAFRAGSQLIKEKMSSRASFGEAISLLDHSLDWLRFEFQWQATFMTYKTTTTVVMARNE